MKSLLTASSTSFVQATADFAFLLFLGHVPERLTAIVSALDGVRGGI
jgi:hypothetical protein